MHKGRCLVLFLFSLSVFADNTLQTAKSILQKGNIAFEKNDCKTAVETLQSVSLDQPFDNEDDYLLYYKILGICYFQLHKPALAEQELEKLLYLRPGYELDGFVTPPPLLDLFSKIKLKIVAKQKEIEEARKLLAEEKKEEPIAKKILKREITLRRVSQWAAFVPLGYPQFENDEFIKGYVIASSEIGLLLLNIGSYWLKQSYIDSATKSLPNEDAKSSYNKAQIVQVSALVGLIGVYIYGVIDGLIRRQPMVQESVKEELIPWQS